MRIALYGDSMTEYLHRPPKALAEQLARLQPATNWELFNYGIGATRAELVLYRLRFEYWHGRERMQPLHILEPDVIVLESCAFNNANDQAGGLDNFKRIWEEILATCAELAPQAKVLLCLTIPAIADMPDERANRLFYHAGPEIFAQRHRWRTCYQEVFAEWAVQNQKPLVDVRRHILDLSVAGTPVQQWVAADGVHPNPRAVELISLQIAHAVRQLLISDLQSETTL